MDVSFIHKLILGIQLAGYAVAGIIIVYLIFQRVREKRSETFEDRNN